MIRDRQRFLNFLGITQGAGKIISGEDLLLKQISARRIKFLILAMDAGRTTRQKFCNKIRYYRIPYNAGFSKNDLSHAIGRYRTVLGIIDTNFANHLIELNQNIKGQ